jgi:hypothetical protein
MQARSHRLPTMLVPSHDPAQRLRQLEAITHAYESIAAEKPDLPDPASPAPAALAARTLRDAIADGHAAIDSALDQLARSESRAAAAAAALADAGLLAAALRARTARLEDARARQSRLGAAERAERAMRAKRERAREFEREAARLRRALDAFVRGHVSAMLAAEELGGPVIGTLADADEDALAAGFSAQGRPRASKRSAEDDGGRRQMRIDEIWGVGAGGRGGESAGEAPSPELQAACDEVSGLVDDLLRALAGKSNAGVYVDLRRDSAAARFLVRAKVAQYHPKDARKLRLIDFGRELDA